jgi:hypothetical protein
VVLGYCNSLDYILLQSNHDINPKYCGINAWICQLHPTCGDISIHSTPIHDSQEIRQHNRDESDMKCKIINGRKVCKAQVDDQKKLLQEFKSSITKDKPLKHYRSSFRGDSCTISETEENKYSVRCKRKENQEVLHRMLKREDVRGMLP